MLRGRILFKINRFCEKITTWKEVIKILKVGRILRTRARQIHLKKNPVKSTSETSSINGRKQQKGTLIIKNKTEEGEDKKVNLSQEPVL